MSQIAGNMDARSEVNLDDSTTRRLGDLVAVLRPSQWAKNVFVLVPVLFSEKAFYRDELLRSVIATACFCLLSSVVYITNDLIDRPADRSHPRKRRRPIASGRVGAGTAVGLAVALVLVSTGVGSLSLPRPFLGFALAYLVNSMAYCFWLKNEVILDVIVISLGFVLRLLAGCAAIGVEPSSWIIVCGFNLALVLGFGKRRSELNVVDDPGGFRRVLLKYTPFEVRHPARQLHRRLSGLLRALHRLARDDRPAQDQLAGLHDADRRLWPLPLPVQGPGGGRRRALGDPGRRPGLPRDHPGVGPRGRWHPRGPLNRRRPVDRNSHLEWQRWG